MATVFRQAMKQNVVVAAQTQNDAERYQRLGVPSDRISIAGNIKFDIQVPEQVKVQGHTLRETYFNNRFVWVAGSTHEGEEAQVLDAHRALLEKIPEALLILVPRHPPRFDAVREWLGAEGVRWVARSRDELVQRNTQVLLGDTLGELLLFYAAADVAFVGGSFVRIGGHNLLEPAALGVPVVTGPHNFNAPDIATRLLESGAALEVATSTGLSRVLIDLSSSEDRRMQMGRAGTDVIDRNRGALERVLGIVESQLSSNVSRA
jgi:3-deoxy-D-manno-octulosonic-acid transferase